VAAAAVLCGVVLLVRAFSPYSWGHVFCDSELSEFRLVSGVDCSLYFQASLGLDDIAVSRLPPSVVSFRLLPSVVLAIVFFHRDTTMGWNTR
jgi:hypothetical protein